MAGSLANICLGHFLLVHFQEPFFVEKEFWYRWYDLGRNVWEGQRLGDSIRCAHTLDVALGGIAEKPGVVDGLIEIREYLCLTLCFDHDVIDGAPAARFTQRFKELIESGYGLTNLVTEERSICEVSSRP